MSTNRHDFKEASPGDCERIVSLLNQARYFPRTTPVDFRQAFLEEGSSTRKAYLDTSGSACFAYHLHPYTGYLVWIACSPNNDPSLLEGSLDFVEAKFQELGIPRYGISAADLCPQLLKQLEQRGYQKASEEIFQSLDLGSFQSESLQASVVQLKRDGFAFVSLSDIISDEALITSLYHLQLEAAQDIPNLAVVATPTYQNFLDELEKTRAQHQYCMLIVKEKEIAAIADHRARQNGHFLAAGTGVRRAYRGLGLAVAAKYAATKVIQQAGGHVISTCNDHQNLAMLRINQRLGFQQIGRQYLYQSPTGKG